MTVLFVPAKKEVKKYGCIIASAPLFWAKVNKTSSCWLWLAGTDKDGYGKFQISIPGENKQIHTRAHRYAFFLKHGRLPVGNLLHSCHTPGCVNWDHVSEGSQSKNVFQSAERGTHHSVKLTPDRVREVRARYASGEKQADIARSLGVKFCVVNHVIKEYTWSQLT